MSNTLVYGSAKSGISTFLNRQIEENSNINKILLDLEPHLALQIARDDNNLKRKDLKLILVGLNDDFVDEARNYLLSKENKDEECLVIIDHVEEMPEQALLLLRQLAVDFNISFIFGQCTSEVQPCSADFTTELLREVFTIEKEINTTSYMGVYTASYVFS